MEEIGCCPADQATYEYKTTYAYSCFSILAFVAAVVLSLTGCATIKGAPDPVIDTDVALADLKSYLAGDVVTKFYSGGDADRGGISARDWRDRVISATQWS